MARIILERYNPEYIHHQDSGWLPYIREIVFGLQDGMVSTLGALTGIAIGSQDLFTVILAGFVVILVEAVSMSIGSYVSTLSEAEIEERILEEEREEIEMHPEEEQEELRLMYIRDGWSDDMARKMAEEAGMSKELMLREMSHRELDIVIDEPSEPVKNGLVMFFSYAVGGTIPLASYFIFPLQTAIIISVASTLVVLFILGASITKFTKRNWFKAGLRMFLLASVALGAGYLIGSFADSINLLING